MEKVNKVALEIKPRKIEFELKYNVGVFILIMAAVSILFMLTSALALNLAPRSPMLLRSWAPLGFDNADWNNIYVIFDVLFWASFFGYAYMKRALVRELFSPLFSEGSVASFAKDRCVEIASAGLIVLIILCTVFYKVPPVAYFASWRDSAVSTVDGWFASLAPEDEMQKEMRRHREEMEKRMHNPAGVPKPPGADLPKTGAEKPSAAEKPPEAAPAPALAPDSKADDEDKPDSIKLMMDKAHSPAQAPNLKTAAPVKAPPPLPVKPAPAKAKDAANSEKD